MTAEPADADRLTHVDDDGRARMIDVGGKEVTRREAVAEGIFSTTAHVVDLLRRDALKKADALATARIAGIAGAKRTSDLIPLCHPLPLDSVALDLRPEESRVRITATVTTSSRTGVEMEALTAVAIAGLTLHDMVKAVDPAASLTDVRLLTKTGGKRGEWSRDQWLADTPEAPSPASPADLRPGTAAVLVASTRGARGERDDTTGPVIADWLRTTGFAVDEIAVVADAEVSTSLPRLLSARPAVILTTGGTGASPTDVTPEATAPLLDRELPGVAEAIRAAGAAVPTAALSRGLAGISHGTVIVNLPGSPGGVLDGLEVLDGLLAHLVAQIAGGGDHVPVTSGGRHTDGAAAIETDAGAVSPDHAVPHRHGPHLHEKKVDR